MGAKIKYMITGNEPIQPLTPTQQAEAISPGLTIRQHFAALAMQGLCANAEWGKALKEDDWDDFVYRVTTGAVDMANSLISQLNETK